MVQIVTVSQIAKELSVSSKLIYRQVERGDIPHFRVGAAIRFDVEEVLAWAHRDELSAQAGAGR